MDFSVYEKMAINFRRELHKIPEVGGEEYKTCEYIYNTLKSFGIENTKKIFETGVVARIGNEVLPCVAFRADMDGLPISEKTDLPFKSIHEGKMHACGHDGHMAVLLALAKLLKDNEKSLKKSVKLIFQPREETDGGALGMIEEGVLKNPEVEKIFGFHFWPEVEAGKVMYSFGSAFAECERFEIYIQGNGGHGALPKGVKNCLYALSEIILEIKEIADKNKNSIISQCSVKSNGFHNIFADSAVIYGTIRTVIENEREKIEEEIKNICSKKPYDCVITPEFVFEYPCSKNHDEELMEIVRASEKVVGKENVYEGECTFAAEDFGFFTALKKGAHIKIGTYDKNNPNTKNPLHNPMFDISEDVLSVPLKIFWEIING